MQRDEDGSLHSIVDLHSSGEIQANLVVLKQLALTAQLPWFTGPRFCTPGIAPRAIGRTFDEHQVGEQG